MGLTIASTSTASIGQLPTSANNTTNSNSNERLSASLQTAVSNLSKQTQSISGTNSLNQRTSTNILQSNNKNENFNENQVKKFF